MLNDIERNSRLAPLVPEAIAQASSASRPRQGVVDYIEEMLD